MGEGSTPAAPHAPPLAFFWAMLQPLRAVWWQLTIPELRKLALKPLALTFGLGISLLVATFMLAAPLQHALWGDHPTNNAIGVAGRIVLHAMLAFVALILTLRLQGAVNGAYLERMSLFVQEKRTGSAPEPVTGVGKVLVNAVRSAVPSFRALLIWALMSLIAFAVVLIPVAGPVLVLPLQVAVASGFLAHGAVADSRGRLDLPRWLYVREAPCLLGLTLGFVPFVLFPPLMLVGGGAIAISGALVAIGTKYRRAELVSLQASTKL